LRARGKQQDMGEMKIFKKICLVMIIPFLIPIAPVVSSPVQADSFSDVKESCDVMFGYFPHNDCYDMFVSAELTPQPSSMMVSWVPARQMITFMCPPSNRISDCYVSGYQVKASYDPVTKTGGDTCTTTRLGPYNCVVTGLRDGVQYTFTISALMPGWDRDTTFTTPTIGPATPCCSLPAPQSDVVATVVADSLDVTWAPSPEWGGATTLAYVVTTDPPSVTCTAEILTCRLEGLDYAKPYRVLVKSQNGAGESAPTFSSAIYSIASSSPESPAITNVKFGLKNGAKITWSTPVRDGGSPISRYTVTAQPGVTTCIAQAAKSGCVIKGNTAGKSYSFTVNASNSKGTSSPSAPSVAGKLAGPAYQVKSPSVSASGTTALVSWAKPSRKSGGMLVAYVVRASGNAGTFTSKSMSCQIKGLRPGASYTFAVTTVRTAGASESVTISSIIMPGPPVPQAPAPKPAPTLE